MKLSYKEDEYSLIRDFLYYEAALLDEREFDKWLELIYEEFDYLVYYFEPGNFKHPILLIHDDNSSMRLRIKRLFTDFAWAEIPPSNTMRVRSNIRIIEAYNNIYTAAYNEILYKNRDGTEKEQFFCKKKDQLVIQNEKIRIRRREVRILEGILSSRNLSVIL